MTIYKIEGIEKIDYISKKDGKHIEGIKLYISFPIKADRGIGLKTDDIYLSKKSVEKMSCPLDESIVGCDVDFVYNRFGGISDINLI